MYGLTTIKGLFRRWGLAAFAIAALISLAALPAPALAQNGISGTDFQFQADASIGLARGQTLRLRIAATDSLGRLLVGTDHGIYRAGAGASAHVKVFDGSTGALLQSREHTGLTAGLHWIDINRDDLPAAGEPGTGRLQLWVEMVIVSRPARRGRAIVPAVGVLPPTFEVMDNESGKTTVHGTLTKVGTGTLTLSGTVGTY